MLTNSAHAPTRVKLEALELVERFEVVVTTDTLGFGKPDPRVYREACRLLGADPATSSASATASSGTCSAPWRRPAGVWLDRAGAGTDRRWRLRGLDEVAGALTADLGAGGDR